MKRYIKADSIESITSFLKECNIKFFIDNNENESFNRNIHFIIYDIEYVINWYVNESTLYIGNHKRASQIPFKYIYFDDSYPLVGENKSLGFSYTKLEKEYFYSRDFPYESFRIPIEI